jgi:hypothetical protein
LQAKEKINRRRRRKKNEKSKRLRDQSEKRDQQSAGSLFVLLFDKRHMGRLCVLF